MSDTKALLEEAKAKAKAKREAEAAKDPDPDFAHDDEDQPVDTSQAPPGSVVVDREDDYETIARELTKLMPHPALWRDVWYLWAGHVYQRTSTAEMRGAVWQALRWVYVVNKKRKRLERYLPNLGKVSNLLEALGATPGVTLPRDVAAPFRRADGAPVAPESVAFANGLLEVTTGRLEAPTPEVFSVYALSVPYTPEAPCERWLAFLGQQWGEDAESVALLQEWFGWSMCTSRAHQKMLYLSGPRRSGKGTIFRILRQLLTRAMGTFEAAALGETFGLEHLEDCRVGADADVRWGDHPQRTVARLLQITGDDGIVVPRKHRGPVPLDGLRLMMAGNEWPSVADRTGALAGRLLLLEHTRSFYDAEDLALSAQLTEELEGIARWSAEGLARLLEQGAFTKPARSDAIRAELIRAASPALGFLEEELEIADGEYVSRSDVRKAYEQHQRATGRGTLSADGFGRELWRWARAKGLELEETRRRIGGRREYCYLGIRLVNDGSVVPVTDRQLVAEWLENPKSIGRDVWGHATCEVFVGDTFTLSDILEHVLKIPRERHPQHEYRGMRVLEHLGYAPDASTGRYTFQRSKPAPVHAWPSDDPAYDN